MNICINYVRERVMYSLIYKKEALCPNSQTFTFISKYSNISTGHIAFIYFLLSTTSYPSLIYL